MARCPSRERNRWDETVTQTREQYSETAPYRLRKETGVTDVWLPAGGRRWITKTAAPQTEGRLLQLLGSERRGAPLHIHRDADQTFFVIAGEVTVFLATRGSRPAQATSSSCPEASRSPTSCAQTRPSSWSRPRPPGSRVPPESGWTASSARSGFRRSVARFPPNRLCPIRTSSRARPRSTAASSSARRRALIDTEF
jgi:mannose-6-phosphate isomerase-like protein (cupin superfamily)